jgi:hypothetical protein
VLNNCLVTIFSVDEHVVIRAEAYRYLRRATSRAGMIGFAQQEYVHRTTPVPLTPEAAPCLLYFEMSLYLSSSCVELCFWCQYLH